MLYSLFNKNHETLRFDFDDAYIQVIDNKYLPFALKDYIKTTGEKDMKGSLKDISTVRDYLASRTLNLSRENAKAILNVAALPQSLRTDQKLKIVMACNGLTMQDNFWIKKDNDPRTFDEMCLRHHKLSEVSYDIAILGHHISATADELIPDLTTEGMFPKYWHRTSDGQIELWKTDRLDGKVNAKCEIEASEILDSIGFNHVRYRGEYRDEKLFSVCDCMADDNTSFIPMQDIMDWHIHTGINYPAKIKELYSKRFPDMCVIDFVLANTDRHSGNWGVLINEENDIIDFAPMFDMNQALVADIMGTDISNQIYEPTGHTFIESVKEWAPYSSVDWNGTKQVLPENIQKRISIVEQYKNASPKKDRTHVDDPLINDIANQYADIRNNIPNSDKDAGDD